ncbi:hypothetical protein EC973_002984 [Apophysomyces ossiformis]|uniref:Endoglucanase n=1 Tax=Apophysomyces ossiformis TaxID=679940 RepID=A0A8H7BVV5_9FUNG|nr:hypothetical protein EC973_002984 [Apophysomyces ossiformis]
MWRSDSALSDGNDHAVDLVGGYYDAGNYLKFTLPLAHSIGLLSWGALEWWEGYVKANQCEHLLETIQWGTDWLMKAHPQKDVLYVQVGNGEIDNGPDQHIPTPRPSYCVNATSPGTDVVAMAASALASAALVFRKMADQQVYADELVSHAIALYDFAEKAQPWQIYTKAVAEAKEMYPTDNYTSQLVYGALWLYRVTNQTHYLHKASYYFDLFDLALSKTQPKELAPMDWSDPTGAVYLLGAQLDPTKPRYQRSAETYLDRLLLIDKESNNNNNSSSSSTTTTTTTTTTTKMKTCQRTDDGLLWCGNYSRSNSLVIAQNMAFLALIYSERLDPLKKPYRTFALQQLDYLLGKNRMLTPYVVGIHANSPQNPHHAGASGGHDLVHMESSPPQERHVLYGAVVGGPGKDDLFYDEREDWAQSEVALDYNAPFQGLVAFQLCQDTAMVTDPPYVSIHAPRPAFGRPTPPPPTTTTSPSSTLPTWTLVLLVLSALSLLSTIFALVYFFEKN